MSSKKAKILSIIIPVFNEQNTINKIISKVNKANTCGFCKEIIVINDGSTDNTKKIIDKIKDIPIKLISYEKNNGKGFAIREGLKIAKGDLILIQDADLEYDPKEYPILLKPFLRQKTKVVFGSRELSNQNRHSYFSYYLGGKFITLLANVLFKSYLTDITTGYKVFRRKYIYNISLKCQRFDFCPEVTAQLLKRGISITEVPIKYIPRNKQHGKKIRIKDGLIASWVLFNNRFFQ